MEEKTEHRNIGRKFLFAPMGTATLVLAVICVMSFLAYRFFTDSEHKQLKASFQLIASEHLHTLETSIQTNLHALKTVGAFYHASDSVFRDEFKTFTDPLLLQHPEIQMIAWAPVVRHDLRPVLVMSALKDGIIDFQVTEWSPQGELVRAADRPEYLPLCYAEPEAANRRLLGFDLASDSAFREVTNWAGDHNMVTSSEQSDSHLKSKGLTGLVVFLPVYEQKMPIKSLQERRTHLKGFVCISYNILKIIEASLYHKNPRQFDLLAYDLSLPAKERLLFASTAYENIHLLESTDIWHDADKYACNEVIKVTDKMLLIKYIPSADFEKANISSMPELVLAIGVTTGMLLFVMVLLVLNRSARARKLVHVLQATTEKLEADIEKRRKVETALQSSEELYRTTINAMSDAIHLVDRDLRITMISDTFLKWCQELGLNSDIAGKTLNEAFPFLPDSAIDEYHRIFEEGDMRVTVEEHHLAGKKIITEIHKIPVTEGGRVKNIITVVRDITERRKQEETLRLTQFSIDKNADAAFWIRQDGSFTYVNQAACEALGYSRDELLGMAIYDIDDNYSPDEWLRYWEKIKQWRSFKIESTHRAKDGHTFPVEMTANYLEFEGEKYNCAFARDISELKRVNSALEESLLRYNRIIENIRFGVAILSPKMEIVLVNKNIREWFPEVSISKRPKCCSIFNSSSGEKECRECAVHRSLQDNSDYCQTISVESSDGPKNIRIFVAPIKDENGKITAFVVSADDITSMTRPDKNRACQAPGLRLPT